MPAVTLPARPSGLPSAMTSWPTRSPAASPSSTGGGHVAAGEQHGEVRERVAPDDVRRHGRAVAERRVGERRAGDHVRAGQQVAVGGDDARAAGARRRAPVRTVRLATLGSTASATATTVREYASRGSGSTAGTASAAAADMPRFAAGAIGQGRRARVCRTSCPRTIRPEASRRPASASSTSERTVSRPPAGRPPTSRADRATTRTRGSARVAEGGLDRAVHRPDVDQAGAVAQVRHAAVRRERPAPAARAGVEHRGRQVGVEQRVDGPPALVLLPERRHAEPATGPQEPCPRVQGVRGVGQEEEHQAGRHDVEGRRGRSGARASSTRTSTCGRSARSRAVSSTIAGARSMPSAYPAGPRRPRQRCQRGAATAADIEHPLAGSDRELVDQTGGDRPEPRHAHVVVRRGGAVEHPGDAVR